jgi:serine/threonine protein kinase/formylglycine-generating enzyme required for sulfatase activity
MTLADDSLGRRTLRDVLHAALDLPVEERRRFVESRLPAGAALDEALALLGKVDEVDGFLEQPHAAAPQVFRPALIARIGSYEIERLLGYGSMGVVYLARQSAPARKVALKLLRVDQTSAACVDRFRRESTVLARLSHPGIAQVFEAGVADLGAGEQPWFAMEYVDGEPLTEHARTANLDRRGRVALIAEIARAVQHAHELGVVHRDLKPENVLVLRKTAGVGDRTLDQRASNARARVLDFGVAQLTTDGDSLAALTTTGQVVGTLAYMAPEQARGGVVDARADQFALGAMLYELLTNELPFAVRGKLAHDALRVVADGQWTSPTQHDKSLAGDLSAILGMALAPEANRRYPTVAAFADDLERWLAGRPTMARPRARSEYVARLVRKHPLGTLGSLLVLAVVSIISALAIQARVDEGRASRLALWLADRARLEELTAEAELLWPADSSRLDRIDAWLLRARVLAARLADHRTTFASLASVGGSVNDAIGDEDASAWIERVSRDVVVRIAALAAPGGLVAQLEARRSAAARLLDETVTSRAEEWARARERVRADSRFGGSVGVAGFDLKPQEGLVPLGPDPESGLEEFAAYATGAIPERGPDTGRVHPREGDGLTFVLIPGGDRWVGHAGTGSDPTSPNYAPEVASFHNWGPPCLVRLDPFLLSKFEVTQDQWVRLYGFNPSYNSAGKSFYDVESTYLNPVESISWERLATLLPRFSLSLPTEAQWEVAARAGTTAAYLWGTSFMDLAGRANTNTYLERNRSDSPSFPPDRFYSHAPIGTFEPNPYGLHDVIGNVWEYCLDDYKVDYHRRLHRDGDGLVLIDAPDGEMSRRGADHSLEPIYCYVFARSERLQHAPDSVTGLRPTWPLDAWRGRPLR